MAETEIKKINGRKIADIDTRAELDVVKADVKALKDMNHKHPTKLSEFENDLEMASSWNDLEDKPFYDTTTNVEIFNDEITCKKLFNYPQYDFDKWLNGIQDKNKKIIVVYDGETYYLSTTYVVYKVVNEDGTNPTTQSSYIVGNVNMYKNEEIYSWEVLYSNVSGEQHRVENFVYEGSAYEHCPFVFDGDKFYTEKSGTHTLQIYDIQGDIKTLDEKVIPREIARYSDIPDIPELTWDNIVNKPFGDTRVIVDFFNGTYESKLQFGAYFIRKTFTSEVDVASLNTVNVIYDGIEYLNLQPNVADTYGIPLLYVGNTYLMPENSASMLGLEQVDTGEPFCFLYAVSDVDIYTNDTAPTSHTVVVQAINGELKTLDPKFLPEHSWNNLEDKPFGETYVEITQETSFVIESQLVSTDNALIGELEVGKTYEITWDGVVYNCECKVITQTDPDLGLTMAQKYLGNLKYSEIEGYEEDTGEPFFIIYESTSDKYYAVKTGSRQGTHTIAIKGLFGTSTVNMASGDSMRGPGVGASFTVGETYKVTWDEVVYNCECKYYEYNQYNKYHYVGNLSLRFDNQEDTGEPFLMYYYTNIGNNPHVTSLSGEHTVEIENLVPERTIKINSSSIESLSIPLPFTFNTELVEGQNYKVVLNDKTYICECKTIMGEIPYIGNLSLMKDIILGTGEPFLIIIEPSMGPMYLYDLPGEFTIIVYGEGVKQLDPKFLPDDIGGAGSFIVNINEGQGTGEPESLDKTYVEIKEAYDKGQNIICVGNVTGDIYTLQSISSGGVLFAANRMGGWVGSTDMLVYGYMGITTNDEIMYMEDQLVKVEVLQQALEMVQLKQDNNLTTTSKEIVGAINELKTQFDSLINGNEVEY